ncbi:MAG: GNAT family N-acetyltransferase [Dehalococcoidia bacterium]|nr:GNAT family N-acetyltransferase [Dehalococcoidia bacterium]
MTAETKTGDAQHTYPREARLARGKTFSLRLMDREMRDEMVAFARSLPPADILFLRMDITAAKNVDEWLKNIAAGRTLTVTAWDADKLAGYASLHHNEVLWTRHVGEIRTIVGSDYRGIGLGARLVEEIFAVAKGLGLRKITAQMTADQKGARATFERVGFRPEALLTDHVIDNDGRTHDMLVMSYDIDGFND